MNDDREEDRRRLEGFFRDELRAAEADAPSFDELAAYVEGRLSPAEGAELEERIAADSVLRREVELLRELRDELARPQAPAAARRSWPWMTLAAAAAVAVIAWWLLPRAGTPPGGGPGAPSPAPIAAVSDGDERVVLLEGGALIGLPGVDPDLRTAAAAALRGELPAPPDLRSLRSERSALMGQASGMPSFAPEAPVGTRVSTARPTLRWSPHPDATAYEVKVFDQDFNEQAAGGPIAGTEWQPDRDLAAGRVYLWLVTALTRRGRVSAPAAPQPEARFEVADPTLMAQVARRRGGAPSSHLVAALAFLEAGLLDDADVELQALATANPGAPRVSVLRDRLRALR
jgi:hypothetical protein